MRPNEYQDHVLWAAVTGLGEALDDMPEPVDEEGMHKLERVRATHAEIDQRRELNPYLIDEPMCSQLQTGVEADGTAMNAYADDPDTAAAQLDTAVAQTAQVLAQLWTWPAPAADTATRATKAAASKFHTTVDEMLGTLREKADALADRLRQIDEDGKEQHEAAKSSMEELQAAIVQSRTDVTDLAGRLTTQIDSQRTAFDSEAQSRSEAFDAEVATLQEQAKEQATEFARQSKDAQESQTAKADEILSSLEEREERARALLDSTSRHAIAGDYGKWAARQAKAAMTWTVATVAIGLITAVALYAAISSTADDSIQFTLYKTGVSVIGLIVAGYCARQAAEHRREERVAKRLHLDLAALEPFLENVAEPEELRTEIARRVFVPEHPLQPDRLPRFGFRRSLSVREITELLAIIRATPPPPQD